MNQTYFPGANTPNGFYSRFDAVLNAPGICRRIYIKGGSGCGKSTLMRKLAQTANAHGAAVQQGLCSSDPDSLDALVVPQAGLAICDATAPHILEPALCGCDGSYLDLGRFYHTRALQHQQAQLTALKKENKACYARATQCLIAAQAMYRAREALVLNPAVEQALAAAARATAQPFLQDTGSGGSVRGLFFSGITPKGCVSCFEPFQAARQIYLLRDSYHLAGRYLQQILTLAQAAGQTVVAGYSPLFPDSCPEQLYLPDAGVALIRSSNLFSCTLPRTLPLDLDALVPREKRRTAETIRAQELGSALLEEAVFHLRQAKQIHDELEAYLRPFVDFAGVERVTGKYQRLLECWLQKRAI